jgi:hypothetical protein
MTKLTFSTPDGLHYYVFKQATRNSDPDRVQANAITARARHYTAENFEELERLKLFHETAVEGKRYAFLALDQATSFLKCSAQGLLKVFQRRQHYKHAVCGMDRYAEPGKTLYVELQRRLEDFTGQAPCRVSLLTPLFRTSWRRKRPLLGAVPVSPTEDKKAVDKLSISFVLNDDLDSLATLACRYLESP